MTPQQININYEATGDITFTVTWHPTNINDAIMVVNDFISKLEGEPKQVKAERKQPKPRAEKKPRKTRTLFNEDQKADIIRRYKEGEGPKAISASLGCARSTIGLIIKNAGAVEGRTGAHLNKPKPQPQQQEPEPEPV